MTTFLKDIIDKNIKKNFGYTHIKNGFDLVKKINGMPLQENYQIVSFDITSMYSNIPNDLAVKSILKR